jgi:hypothetical protein
MTPPLASASSCQPLPPENVREDGIHRDARPRVGGDVLGVRDQNVKIWSAVFTTGAGAAASWSPLGLMIGGGGSTA